MSMFVTLRQNQHNCDKFSMSPFLSLLKKCKQIMGNVVKDIGEIWTRLFDHKPFLNGEIKYFVREFEEKRCDREVEGLFQILETGGELKDSEIERIKQLADIHLPHLAAVVGTVSSKCDEILAREQVFRQDKTVEKCGELRSVEWESFIDDIALKCAKVDATFAEKEKDLRDFYLDLEEKLHISPTHTPS